MKYQGDAVQKYVNRMTNWQRKQWQRNGTPVDVINLEYYSTLQRPSHTQPVSDEAMVQIAENLVEKMQGLVETAVEEVEISE